MYFIDPPAVEVLMDPSTPLKAIDKSDAILMCNVTNGNPSNLQRVSEFQHIKVINNILSKCVVYSTMT